MTNNKKAIRAERQKIMQQLAALEIRRDRGEKIAEADFEALGNKLSALNAGRSGKEDRTYDSKCPKVTKELIAIAEKNGISKRALRHRVYEMKMDPSEAARIKRVKRTSGIKCEKSGLTVEGFLFRKQQGATDTTISREFGIGKRSLALFKEKYALKQKDIEAMRQPFEVKPNQPHIFDSWGRRIIPPEVLELGIQNDIPKATVYTRICQRNWDYYKAAVTPAMNGGRYKRKRLAE